MKRVTNFRLLKISTPTLSSAEITTLLEQSFPSQVESDIVSFDFIRASQADPELFETSYTE